MASYFNKTRGVITLSLRTGESAVVPPKATIHLTEEQDRSASILSRVRKGFLILLKEKKAPVLFVEPSPSTSPKILSSPVAKSDSESDDECNGESTANKPSMKWTKDQLIDHAMMMGIDVHGKNKSEILAAIEEEG